jgi:hypothetical protein
MMDDTGGGAASTLQAGRPRTVSEENVDTVMVNGERDERPLRPMVTRFNVSVTDCQWTEIWQLRAIGLDHEGLRRRVVAFVEEALAAGHPLTAPEGTCVSHNILTVEAYHVA